jgi:metal-sulfur cluster biosynthetic enzyme
LVTESDVRRALERVTDPEYALSVVDLGLIYGVTVREGTVAIDLTFTSIGCPAMDMIVGDIEQAVRHLPGVEAVQVEVVWNPPWTRDRISSRGRRVLQTFGVV